jgi:hypothetical protein
MNRSEWFKNLIGKKVYRSSGSCKCNECVSLYKNGMIIVDETHAEVLAETESLKPVNRLPVRFFKTKVERDKYENGKTN